MRRIVHLLADQVALGSSWHSFVALKEYARGDIARQWIELIPCCLRPRIHAGLVQLIAVCCWCQSVVFG